MPVVGDDVSRGPQAVAVQHTGGVPPVRQHDAGRAVPGLHLAVEILVEGADLRVDVVYGLPGRRQQDAHRLQHVHAAGAQHFQHVVQAGRIRAGQRHDRIEIGNVVELVGAKVFCACNRPVAVALDRVDFTVVGKKTKRLRQAPFRQGVGRETLVKHGNRGFETRVAQIRIKLGQRRRHDHALVTDRDRRQAGDIGFAVGDPVLGPAPREKQPAIEPISLHRLGCVDEHLFDPGQGTQGKRAADGGIGRHDTPAGNFELELGDGPVQGLARGAGRGFVPGQEYGTGGKPRIERKTQVLAHGTHETHRKLEQQAAAVAGFAVGRNRAAVRQPRQRRYRGLDDPVAGHVVEVCDQAEAATVPFERGVVQAIVDTLADTLVAAVGFALCGSLFHRCHSRREAGASGAPHVTGCPLNSAVTPDLAGYRTQYWRLHAIKPGHRVYDTICKSRYCIATKRLICCFSMILARF